MENSFADKQDNCNAEQEAGPEDDKCSFESSGEIKDVKENTNEPDSPAKPEDPLKVIETTDKEETERRDSDQDILLRKDEFKETRSKWNQKCTVITILSKDGNDEESYLRYKKNATDTKTKKLPNVLSKLCIGPGSDDSVIGTRSEKPKEDATEDCDTCDDDTDKDKKLVRTGSKLKSKTLKIIFKNKTSDSSEGLDQSNRSRSVSGDSVQSEGNADSIENDDKTTSKKHSSPRTSKRLTRMFSMKGSSTVEGSNDPEERLSEGNGSVDNIIFSPPTDSEEEIELRKKPQSLKQTISKGLRNSFRLKRALSEPAQKRK